MKKAQYNPDEVARLLALGQEQADLLRKLAALQTAAFKLQESAVKLCQDLGVLIEGAQYEPTTKGKVAARPSLKDGAAKAPRERAATTCDDETLAKIIEILQGAKAPLAPSHFKVQNIGPKIAGAGLRALVGEGLVVEKPRGHFSYVAKSPEVQTNGSAAAEK